MSRIRPDVQYTKLEHAVDLSGVEEISDLKGDSIQPDVPDLEAIARPNFTVEWGIRTTDGALVLHFYPKVVGDNVATAWDEEYRMDKRLEHALPEVFDIANVTCGFEQSHNSFYVIVGSVISVDLRLLVQRFLEKIEGAPIR